MVNLFTHFRPPNWLYEEATFTEEGQLGWCAAAALSRKGGLIRKEGCPVPLALLSAPTPAAIAQRGPPLAFVALL